MSEKLGSRDSHVIREAILAQGVPAVDRPNVIIIYTDDQGTVDAELLRLEGPEHAAHRRAGRAGRSLHADVRAVGDLLGVPGRADDRTDSAAGRRAGQRLVARRASAGMPHEEVTIAEMLKAAGYATGHIGKWHLGYTPETMPNGQGFDYSFGHMGGCIDNYSHFFYWAGPNRHDLWRNGEQIWDDGQFFPDLMAEECEAFIEQNQDRPFFIYWAINVPHYPLQGTGKWREVYKDLPVPAENVRRVCFHPGRTDRPGGGQDRRAWAAREDADHLPVRPRPLDRRADLRRRRHAGPYRGAKGCLFEGGLRVPSIVSMPGTIPEGEARDQMATGCDWLPTIADFCGAPLPRRKLDGKSLKSVILTDGPSPHESFYWQLGRARRPNGSFARATGNCWATRGTTATRLS